MIRTKIGGTLEGRYLREQASASRVNAKKAIILPGVTPGEQATVNLKPTDPLDYRLLHTGIQEYRYM